MTRQSTRAVAIAVALAVLVLIAPIVIAGTNTAVASIHTTDTDFNNAATLENFTVTGSGASASIEVTDSIGSVDGFEDNDISEYSGDTTAWSTQSTTVHNGTYALEGTPRNNRIFSANGSGLNYYPNRGSTIRFWTRSDDVSNAGMEFHFFSNSTSSINSGYAIWYDPGTTNLTLSRWDGGARTDLSTTNISLTDGQWFEIVITDNSGTITATAYSESGTQLAQVSATDSTYSYRGIGFGNNPGNQDDSRYFDAVRATQTQTPSTYISQNHTVERSIQGFGDVTEIANATATFTWETSDGTGWETLNQTDITTTGNHTFTWAEETNETVRLNLTVVQSGSANPSFSLASEGVSFTNRDPTVDNASASPSGGEKVTSSTVTLSMPVNDTDFQTAQGDSVTVDFFVNGSKVGSDTRTSNGTAEVSYDEDIGGTREWYAVANDSYGGSQQSSTFTFTTPSDLHIRNESNPDQLVDNVTIDVLFIGSDTIVSKNTTNGKIDLSGLPVGEEMIVIVEAPGWHNRNIIIDSLYEQDSVYLVNGSVTVTEITFTVEDRTGEFPSSTSELLFKRPLELNGTYEFRRVAADRISDAGYHIAFVRDKRYRLEIRNPVGDIKDLGHVTANKSFDGKTIQLVITSVNSSLQEFNDYEWNATYENRDGQQDRINFILNVTLPDHKADDVQVAIYEYGNESNEILNKSYGDDVSSLSVFKKVPDDNSTWVVEWSATLDGETIDGKMLVGGKRYIQSFPLDAKWKERGIIALMLITAGLFSLFNAGAGAIILAGEGAIGWYTGLLPPEIGAGVIILGFTVGVLKVARGGFR